MRKPVVFSALSAAFLAAMALAASADDTGKERVVVTNYDPSPSIWTRGSLAIVMKKDGALAVGLDFAMPKGRLESMTLRGAGWKLDVTKEVSSLVSPYPLRAQTYLQKVDATGVHEFSLLLPFGVPGDPCKEMRLHVVDGRLAEHGVATASEVQCEP
jgi:hypothetical protein